MEVYGLKATGVRRGEDGSGRRGSKPRWTRLGLLLSLAALLISACSSGSTPQASKPSSLTFWGAQETPQAVKDLITAYGNKTGIKTSFVVIPGPYEPTAMTRFVTGDKPDVIFWQPQTNSLLEVNAPKNFVDLSDMAYIKKVKYGLATDAGRVNGKLYAAVFGFPTVFGVFYNKKVFADNGLTAPATFSDFLAIAESLKSKGIPALYLAGGDGWPPQLPLAESWTDPIAGGLIQKINANQAKWTDQGIVDGINQVRGVVTKGYANPDYKTATYPNSLAALLDGKVGMVSQGSWSVPGLLDAAGGSADIVDNKIGFFAWPSQSHKAEWQASNLTSISVMKTGDASREQAARDFITFATGDGYQTYLDAAKEPPVIDGFAAPKMSLLMQDIVKTFSAGSEPSPDMIKAVNTGDYGTWLAEVLAGTLTPEKMASNMQDAFEKAAKIAGLPGF